MLGKKLSEKNLTLLLNLFLKSKEKFIVIFGKIN